MYDYKQRAKNLQILKSVDLLCIYTDMIPNEIWSNENQKDEAKPVHNSFSATIGCLECSRLHILMGKCNRNKVLTICRL